MTTLELFKKHRKGEVSRERFLYEVRRDNNLPWVTNTTSYDDAVKILKNKGIIRESQEDLNPQFLAKDRVNPYFLKKGVEQELSKQKELDNASYEVALNKAAEKLRRNPHAFDDLLITNASEVHAIDKDLETKAVKANNHVDEKNGMKKIKGQETLKAMSAPTKENRKGKPKGVKVMPDKGVEGKEKIIKEIADYIKKKLRLEENTYHDFHEGMKVPMEDGEEGTVKEINGGTLCIVLPDGSEMDMQMNHAQHLIDKSKELPQSVDHIGAKQEYESGYKQMEEGDDDKTPPQIGDTVLVTSRNQYQGQKVIVKDIVNGFVVVEVGTLVPTEELEGEDIDGDTVMYDGEEVEILGFDEDGNPYLNLGNTASMHLSDVEKVEDEVEEAIYKRGNDIVVASSTASDAALKAGKYTKISGTEDAN